MRFAIAYSKKDPAGINIVEEFKRLGFAPQIPIIELKKLPIYCNDLDVKSYPELKSVDFVVFASTHKSEAGNPSLSLHAPGNWRNADLGGFPGKVCKTSAFVLKYLFQNLKKISEQEKLEDYEITLEVTHHGPLINLPCCFIELGSSERQWGEKSPAKVLAKTLLTLQDYKPGKDWIPSVGLGGPHYAPTFNKIQLNSNYAVSHIIPQYVLPLTNTMIEEAEKKTSEQINEVLIDWKGCGRSEQRGEAVKILEFLGLSYKRTKDVEK